MTAVAATAKEQAAQIQKVSAQLEVSKPATRVVKQSLKLKTISAKPARVEAASQRLIPTGKRSGLLTHIAATEKGSSAAHACEFKYLVALYG